MRTYIVKATWTHPVHPLKLIFREFISSGETEEEATDKVKHLLGDSVWEDNFATSSIEIPLPYEIF